MKLKTNFVPLDELKTFYTDGKIQATGDGKYIFCCCSSAVNMLDASRVTIAHAFSHVDDSHTTFFTLSPCKKILITANQKSKLRQWDVESRSLIRTWTSEHGGPVSSMDFDSTSTLLCTGAADGTVRVWDVVQKFCTNLFRDHSGVVRLVKFNPKNSYELFTSCDSYKIRGWNLEKNELFVVLQGHFSLVTSLEFSERSGLMYSSSRDKVILVWDVKANPSKRTIPVFEGIESMVLLPGGSDAIKKFSCLPCHTEDHLILAGSSGKLSVWNASTGKCVVKNESFCNEGGEGNDGLNGFLQVFLVESSLICVTADQNIIYFDPSDLTIANQIVGNNGSVCDLKFVDESRLAVATCSNLLKVYDTRTWACKMFEGHSQTILCVDSLKVKNSESFYILTGSKDNTVCLWLFEPGSSTPTVYKGEAHIHSVNGVCFSSNSSNSGKGIRMLSCSTDKTIKIWDYELEKRITMAMTTEGHRQEINCIAESPNGRYVATGSRDKSAKLWSPDLRELGTFSGHKRGIWSVKFSPADKVLATASADTTIRLWDITSFACLATFEGHSGGALRVSFLSHGTQLLSCASDGEMKIWTIKKKDCIKTFEAHEDKVWALAVNEHENKVMTGAGDGSMTCWKDVTEEERLEAAVKNEEFKKNEQDLLNLLHKKQFSKALELAITLDQPRRTLDILQNMIDGDAEMFKELACLRENLFDTLLGYAVVWNQNSKNFKVAQTVVYYAVKMFAYEDLVEFKNFARAVEGMILFTERHYARAGLLLVTTGIAECLLQSWGLPANFISSSRKKIKTLDVQEIADDSDESSSDMDTT